MTIMGVYTWVNNSCDGQVTFGINLVQISVRWNDENPLIQRVYDMKPCESGLSTLQPHILDITWYYLIILSPSCDPRIHDTCDMSIANSEHSFLGKFGSCRALLNHLWKQEMALSTFNSFQHVLIKAAVKHLTSAEKGGWCTPHGSAP